MKKDGLFTAEGIEDATPDWVYVVPPDTITKFQVYFVVVQVSKHRHVVAKYDGKSQAGMEDQKPLTFDIISIPMKWDEAQQLAARLQHIRHEDIITGFKR
jgi:hypothetical protein